jgi:hypothetical protein
MLPKMSRKATTERTVLRVIIRVRFPATSELPAFVFGMSSCGSVPLGVGVAEVLEDAELVSLAVPISSEVVGALLELDTGNVWTAKVVGAVRGAERCVGVKKEMIC